jgi:beta-hydroxylase
LLERAAARLVTWNNGVVRRCDPDAPNPRDVSTEAWCRHLVDARGEIRREWDAFAGAGGRLPLIEDFLGGHQGNTGSWWRAGGLITRSRPRDPLAALFPRTVEALLAVPGLLSAMWSVLGPGGELLPHTGDNAGALNYLIGVDCPAESGLSVEGRKVDLSDGAVVVFDDTFPHATWNRSDRPRVVLLGDILRDVPGPGGWANRVTQAGRHHLVPGYRRAITVGAELHAALND